MSANLKMANLRGADLRGADLRYADLRETDLRGADLRRIFLRPNLLAETEVEMGKNLEKDNDEIEQQVGSPPNHKDVPLLQGATMPNGQKYEDWLNNEIRGKAMDRVPSRPRSASQTYWSEESPLTAVGRMRRREASRN